MFFELVATFTAGLAAAGVVLLLGRLTGGRLPRWLTPVAAGAAMIGFTIWSEYTWYSRISGQLPEEFVVTTRNESSAPWRPWTYLAPITDRFAALDRASIRTNEAVPDQRLADVFFWGRWAPIRRVTVAFDCAEARRAAVTEGVELAEDGELVGADWRPTDPDDAALRAACGSA